MRSSSPIRSSFFAALSSVAVLLVIHPAAAQLTLPGYYGNYPPLPAAGQWSSSNVFYSGGYLTYAADGEGNRVPDYSYAGYHYGEKALPVVPVVNTLGPIGGDETARIQAALDAIGSLPQDANGHRGTLLLLPGTYEIWGTLRLSKNGVVLRGSGDGTNPAVDTILFARGNTPHQRTVVIIGSNSGSPWSTGTQVNITNQFVQVGALSFNVASASGFSVGQEVQIRHPSPQAWIDAVDGGGVVSDPPWTAGSKDLRWIRKITKIEGTKIYLDAPIYNHLDRALVQATIAPVTGRNLVTESGVESLRIDIETLGGEDENHAWNAVGVVGADNCWVYSISARYFGYACVRTSGAIRITVKDCVGTDPVAIRTGGRMYHFATDGFSQLVLFTGCHASGARHSFISNGTTTVGGAVWHRCTMNGGDFEAHRQWSQGMLLDNCRELGATTSQAKLINRGDFGSSHGWGAAHSTIWGFNKEIVVQKPPTAQNYCVSTEGFRRGSAWYPGPWGSIEIRSTGPVVPESLYEAQLCDRIALRPVFLIARHSGKAIRVDSGSTAEGAAIIQSPTNALGADGEWFVVGIGGGFSRVSARHSGKDLTVNGASTNEGAGVVQGTYFSSAPAHDEWQIVPVSNNFYRVVNRLSGKVLGIAGASTSDGALLQQMAWTGALHQQFRIEARPMVFIAPPPLILSAAPASQFVIPGSNVTYTVTVQSDLPATNTITLSVGGLPANTTAGFTPATLTNSGVSSLSITTAVSTPLGSFPLTITGTASGATNTATATLIVSSNAQAAPGWLRFSAGGAPDQNWSHFLNWTNSTAGGVGTPGPFNYLLFANEGVSENPGEVNNVMNDDFTIGALAFTNTAGFHTTLIEPGRTLTIISNAPGFANAPAINVGMETYAGSGDSVRAAITGGQGSLVISNAASNLQIRQGFGSGTVATYAELDLSGLGTFNANIGRIQLGAESGTPRRTSGTLWLARDNVITLNQALSVNTNFTSGSPSLYLGHNTQTGNSRGSSLYLGVNNIINVNYVVIGRGNQTGNLLAFNPAFLGDEPSAQFRASDGSGRVGLWIIGDNSPGSLTTPSSGTNDFSGGTIDALVDRMFVGRGRVGTNANTGFGTLTFDAGTINVNQLRLGTMVDEFTSTNASGVGVANVNGDAVLIVNDVLDLAHVNITAPSSASAIAGTRGTLNVNGGTLIVNSAVHGGGTSTLSVSEGAINLNLAIGTPAAPISAINLTNATLRLKVNGANVVSNVVAAVLTAGGVTTIGLDSLANVSGTVVFPLISYATFNGSIANFALELPAGYSGALLHNAAQKTIDLVITPSAAAVPRIHTVNIAAGNLVAGGTNGAPYGQYYLLSSTNLAVPLTQWTVIATNLFDANGGFSFTNSVDGQQPQQFYLLQMP